MRWTSTLIDARREWHRVFAWLPVEVKPGKWLWLEWYARKMADSYDFDGGTFWYDRERAFVEDFEYELPKL